MCRSKGCYRGQSRVVKRFSREEVTEAIFAMNPNKAPRDDGLNSGFYQKMIEYCRGVSHSIGVGVDQCVNFPKGD